MLYDFKNEVATKLKRNTEKLSDFLDKKGYPSVSPKGFAIIRKDLSTQENAGNIEYREDGIYLKFNGREYKGYIYIKNPNVSRFGFPKFHISECITIKDQKLKQNFVGKYFWHNSSTVSLEDRANGETYENVTLELCWNCRKIGTPNTTEAFHDSLKENQQSVETEKKIEVDFFGYVREWQQISQKHKEKKNYTCERCHIQMEGIDKRYIHSDHKNGDKTHNHESNLESLCILCHCYKDELHRENFGKRRMKVELKTFINKFRNRLVEINNPHLERYNADNGS
jgi:hypothetical protein